MNRPWQYWLAFGACVLAATAAMAWLTRTVLALDRAEAQSRQIAELEQRISRALWRMDVKLVPLLAQEAARPYFVYRPWYAPPGAVEQPRRPSPLLASRAEFVRLNFECNARGQWVSPQVPHDSERDAALQQGIQPSDLQRSAQLLAELEQRASYTQLIARLPDEWLQASSGDALAVHADAPGRPTPGGKVIQNVFDLQQVAQQAIAPPIPDQRAQELQLRDDAVQAIAQNAVVAERSGWPRSTTIREGVSQPVWLGNELLLARRTQWGQEVLIQGCWLDWPALRDALLAEVADLLPQARLVAVRGQQQAELGRMLAGLPVQLHLPAAQPADAGWTPIRWILLTAWLALASAVVAVALLSHGMLTLSERRHAFVSSVTHELRTPLTTFLMYSEMLAEGMVDDPAQQKAYLQTLRNESGRLYHLVENVLAYARLERTGRGPTLHWTTVDAVLKAAEARLRDRAAAGGLQFEIRDADNLRNWSLQTDPSAVEQILFNLVDNACKYAVPASDRRVLLELSARGRMIDFQLRDFGSGIAAAEARRLFRPFSKTDQQAARSAPGVGLGLALSRNLARRLGGRLEYQPPAGPGAAFVLSLPGVPPAPPAAERSGATT